VLGSSLKPLGVRMRHCGTRLIRSRNPTLTSWAAILLIALALPSAVASAPGVTLTVVAQADARVHQANPSTNYATSYLRTNAGSEPDVESFLRFTVSGLTQPAQTATLRVYATSGTVDGPAVYATASGWTETTIRWSNRPARTSAATADKGAIGTGTWVEFDVTSLVAGNGTYNFVLAQTSADGVDFRSREAATNKPQLVVTTAGDQDTQPPTAPSSLAADASSPTSVQLGWSAAGDNVGVAGYEIFRDGAPLATVGAVTGYTDGTGAPSTTYAYQVRAFDAAGLRSELSNTAVATTPAPPPVTTFTAAADARVQEANPNTNYATSFLRTDGAGDPDVESYLRFTVSGVAPPVQSARLRVYATSGTVDGPAVFATSSNWTETGIRWSDRPARSSGAIGDKGAIGAGSWVEFDVTSLVAGNGSYGFVLAQASSDGVDFNSREAGSLRPELVVTTGTGGADTVPPSVQITSPPSDSTYTSPQTVTIAASASDDVGVGRVEFYDGAALLGSDDTSPYSVAWTVTAAQNGPHNLTARAVDTSGNTTTSTAVNVTVTISSVGGPITANAETTPMPHSGDAADDSAIWVHPTDVSQSTIIGTDKQGGLAVYSLSGQQLFYYPDGEVNNVDIRYGFMLGGQRVALVVANNYDSSNSIRIYRVDPATRGLEYVAARTISAGGDIYGICMYRSAVDGAYYAINSLRTGTMEQWRLFDNGAGRVDATRVRTFNVGSVVEGCVADDQLGALYVGEEDVGIWRYGAEPGAGSARTRVDSVGSGGHLTADVEGLAIYRAAAGTGYLIASSQGSSDFAVYRREGANEYVTRFSIVAGAIDAVSGTDGIDVSSLGLGSAFPEGVFVAQDTTNNGGNQNFKLVPWGAIARGVSPQLVIDTSVDPRSS
jgi:myo-inositol-hexaphosphate 3-phosphohydrolase